MDPKSPAGERAGEGDPFHGFNPSSINSGIRRLGSKLKFRKRPAEGSHATGESGYEASSSQDPHMTPQQPATPRGVASDSAVTALNAPASPSTGHTNGASNSALNAYASDGGGPSAMARRFSAGLREGLDALDPASMARRSSAGLRKGFNALGPPSVARARALVMSPKQLWHKREGRPPEGYLWAWLGRLRRWRRQWFVAHTAGLLQVYKSSRLDGKVWSISLRDSAVHPDAAHSRQLHIIVGTSLVYLRAQDSNERDAWVQHLQRSIDDYSRSRSRVAGLGMLPGEAAGANSTLSSSGAADGQLGAGSSGLALLELSGVDPEMRLKIRHRVAERWADIQGPQAEFERQVAHIQATATALASSLSLGGPAPPPAPSPLPQPGGSTASSSHAGIAGTSRMGRQRSKGPPHSMEGGVQADLSAATAAAAGAAIQPEVSQAPTEPGFSHSVEAARQLHAAADPQTSVSASQLVRHPSHVRRWRSMGHDSTNGGPSSSSGAGGGLQRAYTQLLGAFREALQREAMRSVELEGELLLMRQRLGGVAAKHSQSQRRSVSTTAAAAAALRRSRSRNSRRGSSNDDGGGDHGVDDDRQVGGGSSSSSEYLSVAGGGSSSCVGDIGVLAELELMMGGQDEDDDESAELCGEGSGLGGIGRDGSSGSDALVSEQDMLSALEVVRQVEFASRDSSATPLLADASTPPPPDVRAGHAAAAAAAGAGAGAAAAGAAGAGAGVAGAAGAEQPVPRSGSGGVEDDEDLRQGEEDEEAEGEDEGAACGALGADVAAVERRRLPAPKPIGRGFSIWSVLKNAMGGDLTKITMPATINEPLSFIQRLAEMMEYRTLLEKALAQPDAPERLLWMAAWCLSPYSSQPFRESKPFNPLLGETFEWRSADGQHRFITEQVSHHPPISAYQSEGLGGAYSGSGELETKSRFWGKSIEIILAGNERLTDNARQEVYEWNRFSVSVNDLILGRFWVDIHGDVKITNRTTGHYALLHMRPCKGHLNHRGRITGTVCAPSGTQLYLLEGSICSRVVARAAEADGGWGEAFVVHEAHAPPDEWAEQYNMTSFGIGLNDPCCWYASKLPPTDSRFRPDQRSLELGEHARATSEKLRLEEKQRAARRTRKAQGMEYRPSWFSRTDPSDRELIKLAHSQPGQAAWAFTGQYWRDRGSWDRSPDIYSAT